MKMKFNKKVGAAGLACITALTMVGSLAYFSDNAVTSAQGTAGTVALAMDSDINFLDAQGMDILNPGDMRDASFEITNMGNKSIDVRTTIALTVESEHYDLTFSGDADAQSEFDLYKASDVELVEGKGYMPKEGAKPIATKEVNGNVITYTIADYSLNGNSDEYDEVESIDGVDAFKSDYDYVLVFKGEAGNEWQDAVVSMDVIVEAKQHENTGAGWEIVAQESMTQGSITKNVVDGEDVLTDANGGRN